MLRVLPRTNQTCLATNQFVQCCQLLQKVESTWVYFYLLQQNLYMLRLLPAQGKLVLQQLTKLPCTAWFPRNFIQSEISILTTGNNLICCETGLSYGKTGSKSVQIVSQHCCGTWLKAMLHVLPPTFKPALPQIRLLESVNTDFSLDKITLESRHTRTALATKQVCLGPVKHATRTDVVSKKYNHSVLSPPTLRKLQQLDMLQKRFECGW